MDTVSVDDVRQMVSLLKVHYGDKFSPINATAGVWALSLDDLTREELMTAVRLWCREERWPPTPADLRALVPRLCRCGRCGTCQGRALNARRAALNRGSGGYDADTAVGPTHIGGGTNGVPRIEGHP